MQVFRVAVFGLIGRLSADLQYVLLGSWIMFHPKRQPFCWTFIQGDDDESQTEHNQTRSQRISVIGSIIALPTALVSRARSSASISATKSHYRTDQRAIALKLATHRVAAAEGYSKYIGIY